MKSTQPFIVITPAIAFCFLFSYSLLFLNNAHARDCSLTDRDNNSSLQARAASGDMESEYELGRRFEYGICVDQNDRLAIHWYGKAGDQSYPDALYRLAVLYDNGWGVSEDDTRAAELYLRAAEKNHVLAQHDLAIMYMQGTGVEVNYVVAYQWLSIAVISGNDLIKPHLRTVAELMTDAQIAEAQSLALTWVSERLLTAR